MQDELNNRQAQTQTQATGNENSKTKPEPPSNGNAETQLSEFIRRRYGRTLEDFEKSFPPSKQTNMLNNLALCLFADPRWNVCTPKAIDQTYGVNACQDWLANQFAFHFREISKQVSYSFCQELAMSTLAFTQLTAPAYMAFIAMCRFGQLGETYGRHDAETYGRLLNSFLRYREINKLRLQREANEKTKQLLEAGRIRFTD